MLVAAAEVGLMPEVLLARHWSVRVGTGQHLSVHLRQARMALIISNEHHCPTFLPCRTHTHTHPPLASFFTSLCETNFIFRFWTHSPHCSASESPLQRTARPSPRSPVVRSTSSWRSCSDQVGFASRALCVLIDACFYSLGPLLPSPLPLLFFAVCVRRG